MNPILHDARSHRNDPALVEVVHRENLDRYRFAAGHCGGKKVLEIGCAFGHGTALLAEQASEVHAIDLYRHALDHARTHCRRPNASFHEMDGSQLTFEPGSFDVVVSFEVIEHVEAPERFVAEIFRVLRPGGMAILSTPNGMQTLQADGSTSDPTHLREYRPGELLAVLQAAGFARAELLGQSIGAGVWQLYSFTADASRMDRLGIRKLLRGRAKRWVVAALVFLRYGKSPAALATTEIKEGAEEHSHVLVALCTK